MGSGRPERNLGSSAKRIARLRLDEARILLECANATKGKRALALCATGTSEYCPTFRAAISAAGLICKYYDPLEFKDGPAFCEALSDAEVIVILEDGDYRDAPFSLHQWNWMMTRRPDITPILIRIGEPVQDLRFLALGFDILEVISEQDWHVVPLHIRECVFNAERRRGA